MTQAAARSRPDQQPPSVVRLGTRASALARTQSQTVADALTAAAGAHVELVEVSTHGDRSSASIQQLGSVGVFVSALRDALLAGTVDIAVHSYKDLPTEAAPGLSLAAVPQRVSPYDVLVSRDGLTLAQLPTGARIGTGAPRRAAQLRRAFPHLEVLDIRGNVGTRMGKVDSGELDAVVLAEAGLQRLGLSDRISQVLDGVVLPAPAQGALAIECRAEDEPTISLLRNLEHTPSRRAVVAERSMLAALQAGCSAPVAGLANLTPATSEDSDSAHSPSATAPCGDDAQLTLRANVTALDGSAAVEQSRTMPATQAEVLGQRIAAALLADGAEELMGNTA